MGYFGREGPAPQARNRGSFCLGGAILRFQGDVPLIAFHSSECIEKVFIALPPNLHAHPKPPQGPQRRRRKMPQQKKSCMPITIYREPAIRMKDRPRILRDSLRHIEQLIRQPVLAPETRLPATVKALGCIPGVLLKRCSRADHSPAAARSFMLLKSHWSDSSKPRYSV